MDFRLVEEASLKVAHREGSPTFIKAVERQLRNKTTLNEQATILELARLFKTVEDSKELNAGVLSSILECSQSGYDVEDILSLFVKTYNQMTLVK